MIGVAGQFTEGQLIDVSAKRLGFGRHGPGSNQHDPRAKLIGHRKSTVSAKHSFIKSFHCVEGVSSRQMECDQGEFDGPKQVTDLTTTCFRKPIRMKISARFKNDALRSQGRSRPDVFAKRFSGFESNPKWLTDHERIPRRWIVAEVGLMPFTRII